MRPIKYLTYREVSWDDYICFWCRFALAVMGLCGTALIINPNIEAKKPEEVIRNIYRRTEKDEDDKIKGEDLKRILANQPRQLCEG